MASRLVLHVGLMKSGTSFLQQVMRSNQERLREQGVLFPGPWAKQVRAVKDVIAHGGPQQPRLAPRGPWNRLVGRVQEHPGPVVLSMEFLGPRQPSKIRQVLDSFRGTPVTVVVTARDLARTIPAMWQENVQNGGTRPWSEYLQAVRTEASDPTDGQGGFWRRQDLPAIVGRWQAGAGPERVALVTVPPRGAEPAVLWRRFAGVVGLDPDGFDLEVPANPSLGLASLEVLRGLNDRLRGGEDASGLTPGDHERVVKRVLAKQGLAGRGGEPRLGYDTAWVLEHAEAHVLRLQELGVRVVGSLEELRGAPVDGSSPDDLGADAQLEAALDGLATLTRALAARRGRGTDGRTADDPGPDPGPDPAPG